MLKGNKIDMRTDSSVGTTEGNDASTKIGAKRYFECSARTGEGVRELFQSVLRPAEKKKCTVS